MPGPPASAAMQPRRPKKCTAARSQPGQGDRREPERRPGGPTNDPRSNPAGVAAPGSDRIPRDGTGSAHNWGELPGLTEIMQLSQGKYRDDYARQIQLYFQEIAADGAKDKPR